ncbi:MAG: ABC transporter ATP-binding protein [Desulfomonilaceae bacterium]|nr:ABC transporter ATP-binding protein [Desulfomonilaceae bacterium]
MIEVEGLTKYYGNFPAVRDVTFRVESGEIVGFLGPNGAGKTTTMRILTCFSPATSGTARILGMDVRHESLKIREKVGYLPENVPLYDWMRVGKYLDFVARAKRIPSDKRKTEIDRVAKSAGVDQVMGRIVRSLSKGYRQRVGLAQALIGDPPILILDEPTIGLDPKQIREIRDLIKGFSRDRTVILSTHILPEVSQVCSRVVIINKGSIVAEDTPDNLIGGHGGARKARVTVKAPESDLLQLLSSVRGVSSVESQGATNSTETSVIVETLPETDVRPELARAVIEKGWDLMELRPLQVSLEDVFIDLVTEESQAFGANAAEAPAEVA